MKRILGTSLIALSLIGCNLPVDDYVDDFADNATELAETIAHNKVVETVVHVYTEKLEAAAKADIDPIGYYKDKIEQTKDDLETVVEKVQEIF